LKKNWLEQSFRGYVTL